MPNIVISFDVGIVNLAYWIGTMDNAVYKTLKWELVDLHALAGTATDAAFRMVDALEQRRVDVFQLDIYKPFIVIETQTSDNVKMKILSHVIQSWFYVHGVAESSIKFVSPRNKLTVYTKPIPMVEGALLPGSYPYRKDISVVHTRLMMQENNDLEWLEYMNSCPKKDDLSDAYLQGVHSLKRQHAIDLRIQRRIEREQAREQTRERARSNSKNNMET